MSSPRTNSSFATWLSCKFGLDGDDKDDDDDECGRATTVMRPGSTLTVQMLSHGQDPDQEVMSLLAPLVEVNALVSADRSYLLALTAGSRIDRFGRFRLHGRAGFPFRVSRSQHRRRAPCLSSCVKKKPPSRVQPRSWTAARAHLQQLVADVERDSLYTPSLLVVVCPNETLDQDASRVLRESVQSMFHFVSGSRLAVVVF